MIASRFWVGGTGTWDAADTTHWSATSGGGGGASVPGSGDTVTLNGSSGGGTVTVNTTVDVTSITMGAFTGTLDFATNDNNVTVSTFSGTGTGTRTLNMGDGTWTFTSSATVTIWDMTTTTNLTFNANASTMVFTATSSSTRTFQSTASLTYNIITVSANTGGGFFAFSQGTVGTLNVTTPNAIQFSHLAGMQVTNPVAFVGTSTNQIFLTSTSLSTQGAFESASGSHTMTWVGIRGLVFSGGASFAATNSLNLGRNSGITITPPSVGGGAVGVIGS